MLQNLIVAYENNHGIIIKRCCELDGLLARAAPNLLYWRHLLLWFHRPASMNSFYYTHTARYQISIRVRFRIVSKLDWRNWMNRRFFKMTVVLPLYHLRFNTQFINCHADASQVAFTTPVELQLLKAAVASLFAGSAYVMSVTFSATRCAHMPEISRQL